MLASGAVSGGATTGTGTARGVKSPDSSIAGVPGATATLLGLPRGMLRFVYYFKDNTCKAKTILNGEACLPCGSWRQKDEKTVTIRGLPFTRHGSRRPPAEDTGITHTRAPSPHHLARASTAALQWRSRSLISGHKGGAPLNISLFK